jgi:hypothetical protein
MNILTLKPWPDHVAALCFFGLIIAQCDGQITEISAAEDKDLPQGNGLAAAFVQDRGLAKHPSVVFVEFFDQPDFRKNWDEVRDERGTVLSQVRLGDDADSSGQCLAVTAVLGSNTGGGLTKWFKPSPTLFVRFYTRFAADCDYVHHFVTLRANQSWQGGDRWSGFGGAGLKPSGEERFSTALEPWGDWGRWPAPGRWNFYSYWHEMKPSPDGKFWGNSFVPAEQLDIKRDQWICAEFMLKHNKPGQPDGEQAFWINGRRMGHWKGFNWRKTPELMANALTVESYVTDRWTKHSTNIVFFDNIVVAREYIGPRQIGATPK